MGSMKKFGFKNIFIGLIVVSIIYLIVIFVYLFAFKTEDKIVLIGESEKIVKVGTKYVLDGAKVYSNYQSNDILIIENKVNINKIGEYDVVYTYKDLKVIRKVKVIDDTPPSITLVGDNPSLYCSNKGYVEEGYKVVDNYDKDLNDKVVITKEEGYINYYVKDSSGNSASIKRKIVIGDKDAPLITLTGGNNITLYKGEKYKDQYKAVDNCDGDITSKVLVTGSVDTNTLGEYKINYKVKDKSGNESSVQRKIKVVSNDKTIYLTFDDGPSKNVTPLILDTLKKYNIKATFFVNDHGDSLNYLIKREYEEGHTVGYHTASHNYSYIYKSENNFFKDLKKIEDKVVNITGYNSMIFRFPGGSSNTVSKSYNKGIMTRLVKLSSEKGYRYYDWNVGSNDTVTQDSNKICKNVIRGLNNKTNIVLMHDASSKKGTAESLECIIKYGLEKGYKFSSITSSTKEVHHGINN